MMMKPAGESVEDFLSRHRMPPPMTREQLMAEVENADKISPQTPGTITGYRSHNQAEIDAVNRTKEFENVLGDWIEDLRKNTEFVVDHHMITRAAETLQEGFMLLNRSIFRPESNLKP